MTDIGLDRANVDTFVAKDIAYGGCFNGVTSSCSGTMAFNVS